jgi:hypothetical protein
VVDEALEKLGLSRAVAVTTARFVAVPFQVAGAAVVTTMPAKLARYFATALGLSLSPVRVRLSEAVVSLVWHISYHHDPGHLWLCQTWCALQQSGSFPLGRTSQPRCRARLVRRARQLSRYHRPRNSSRFRSYQ